MIGDDLVEGTPDLLLTSDLEDYLRSIGAMFGEMEDYANDPDATDDPPFIYRPNYFPNPSFEYDVLGAAPALVTPNPAATTFAVQNGWAAVGGRSLRMTFNALAASAIASANPDPSTYMAVKEGGVVGARAVFNVLNADTTPELWIDWFDVNKTYLGFTVGAVGATAVGVQTLDAPVVVAPTGLGVAYCQVFPVLDNHTAGAATMDAYVDAIQLQPGGPCDPFFSGDAAGYEWLGTPGASASAIKKPYPQPGWSKMLDVDRADTKGLPYLAQWVGERLPQGITDAASRQWIRKTPNAYRGTIQAVAEGIHPLLTGTQAVFTRERWHRSAAVADSDWVSVVTYGSETPDPGAVQDQLRRKLVPADIQLDYETVTSETWSAIQGGSPGTKTWATVESGSPSWQTIESLQPGYVPAGFTLWLPQ